MHLRALPRLKPHAVSVMNVMQDGQSKGMTVALNNKESDSIRPETPHLISDSLFDPNSFTLDLPSFDSMLTSSTTSVKPANPNFDIPPFDMPLLESTTNTTSYDDGLISQKISGQNMVTPNSTLPGDVEFGLPNLSIAAFLDADVPEEGKSNKQNVVEVSEIVTSDLSVPDFGLPDFNF